MANVHGEEGILSGFRIPSLTEGKTTKAGRQESRNGARAHSDSWLLTPGSFFQADKTSFSFWARVSTV
jgi:hypothetical protein